MVGAHGLWRVNICYGVSQCRPHGMHASATLPSSHRISPLRILFFDPIRIARTLAPCARVLCSLLRALSALSLRPRQSFLPPSRPTGSSHTASGVASRALLVPAPLPRAAPFAPTVCWDSISSHCTLPYGAVTFPMLMSLSGRVPHGSPDRGGPCSWLEVGMRISC